MVTSNQANGAPSGMAYTRVLHQGTRLPTVVLEQAREKNTSPMNRVKSAIRSTSLVSRGGCVGRDGVPGPSGPYPNFLCAPVSKLRMFPARCLCSISRRTCPAGSLGLGLLGTYLGLISRAERIGSGWIGPTLIGNMGQTPHKVKQRAFRCGTKSTSWRWQRRRRRP